MVEITKEEADRRVAAYDLIDQVQAEFYQFLKDCGWTEKGAMELCRDLVAIGMYIKADQMRKRLNAIG